MGISYYKVKKRKKLKFLYKLIILLTVLILLIIFFILFVVNPIVIYTVESNVKTYSTMAVNNAVLEVFNYSMSYNDLIEIEKDSGGNITNLSVNSIKLSQLTLETVKLSQLYINDLKDRKVNVPLGTLSGLAFLSGSGPEIKFNIMPVGAVNASFKSIFESAGINQTRHVVLIEVLADIKVVLPMKNGVVKTSTNIYVAENIIVGKIPNVLLTMGSSTSGKLNLIP